MPAPRHNWRPTFIEAFRNSGNVRAACQAASITRTQAYRYRAAHPSFAKEWDDAREEAIDILEATAWQRARAGDSDYLLWKLLQANRRYMYGDKQQLEIAQFGRFTMVFDRGEEIGQLPGPIPLQLREGASGNG